MNITLQSKLIQLDRIAWELFILDQSMQVQASIGQIRANLVECGCSRPNHCSQCRTDIEEIQYFQDKCEILLQEAMDEDRAEDIDHEEAE